MSMPSAVSEFLAGQRIAVAGVSRDPRQSANAIYRKLLASGHEMFAVNPRATEVEGVACYPDVASLPGAIDGLVVVAPPAASVELVRACADRGIPRIWFHRAFGAGSVCPEAIRESRARGLTCIPGGCPLMYCEPVDVFHRCCRWLLKWRDRVPD